MKSWLVSSLVFVLNSISIFLGEGLCSVCTCMYGGLRATGWSGTTGHRGRRAWVPSAAVIVGMHMNV